MTNRIIKKMMSVFLCVTLILSCLPLALSAAAADADNRVVDASTMHDWQNWFGEGVGSTINAGGVWMDKSVFKDNTAFPAGTVSMTDADNNFLVALSAISSNKEIIGYSTIPTDTMLVLDVSGSMSGSASKLVEATNAAIKSLYDTNKNNRVGVVLYSGNSQAAASSYEQGVKLLLPLDRYTTANDNKYIELSEGSVGVDSHVRTSAGGRITASKSVVGGTYIQAGLYEALLQFEAADPVIESNNFQGGQQRLPILVLMSDGAPTTATNNFAEVDKQYTVTVQNNQRPGNQQTTTTDVSVAGNGTATTDSIGFLTQLTASYVLNRMEAHYDRAGEASSTPSVWALRALRARI